MRYTFGSCRPFIECTLLFMVVALCGTAQADSLGKDMWTGLLQGMFTPHANDCSSSEVFLAIGPGSSTGFCIEKSERSAQAFEDARDTCIQAGKRLPEPAEYKWACQAAPAGLSDMQDDYEWNSNFTFLLGNSSYGGAVASAANGAGGCAAGGFGFISGTGAENSFVFRCVH